MPLRFADSSQSRVLRYGRASCWVTLSGALIPDWTRGFLQLVLDSARPLSGGKARLQLASDRSRGMGDELLADSTRAGLLCGTDECR